MGWLRVQVMFSFQETIDLTHFVIIFIKNDILVTLSLYFILGKWQDNCIMAKAINTFLIIMDKHSQRDSSDLPPFSLMR